MAKPKMTEQELQDYLEHNSDMIFGTEYLYGNASSHHFEEIHKSIVFSLESLETDKDEFKV